MLKPYDSLQGTLKSLRRVGIFLRNTGSTSLSIRCFLILQSLLTENIERENHSCPTSERYIGMVMKMRVIH